MVVDTILDRTTEELLELKVPNPFIFQPVVEVAYEAKKSWESHSKEEIEALRQHLQEIYDEFILNKRTYAVKLVKKMVKDDQDAWDSMIKEGFLASDLEAIKKDQYEASRVLATHTINLQMSYPLKLDALDAFLFNESALDEPLLNLFNQYPIEQYYSVLALESASKSLLDLATLASILNDAVHTDFLTNKASAMMHEAIKALYRSQLITAYKKNYKTLAELENYQQYVADRAQKGAQARNKKYNQLRQFAVEAFQSKRFHSIRQAAKIITPKTLEYAHQLNISLSPDNAENTVYKWLLAANKNVSEQTEP